MASELPYLPSYKNVGKLFEAIASAKVPDAFTQEYLGNTLGLKGSGDRALISLLKKLGFLDQTGKPTASYSLLKNKSTAGVAIAEGIRSAYAPLFSSNEKADQLDSESLKGTIAQVAGVDAEMAKTIAYTFGALAKLGDFSKKKDEVDKPKEEVADQGLKGAFKPSGLRHDFHFNFQIHLPSNSTEETYLNIFNAMRKVFN